MTRHHLAAVLLITFGLLVALAIVLLGSATSMARPVPAAERFGEEYVPPPSPVATEYPVLSTPYSVPSAAPTTVVRQVYVAPKVKPPVAAQPVPSTPSPAAASAPRFRSPPPDACGLLPGMYALPYRPGYHWVGYPTCGWLADTASSARTS